MVKRRLKRTRGIYTPDWFNKEKKDPITIKKVRGQDLYEWKYNLKDEMGNREFESHFLNGEETKRYLKLSRGFKSKEALFKATYWSTPEGIQRKLEIATDNFITAIQRFEDISNKDKEYLIELWTGLSDSERQQFFDDNKLLTEKFFTYESQEELPTTEKADSKARRKSDIISKNNLKKGWTNKGVMSSVKKKLEKYYTTEQVSRMKAEAYARQSDIVDDWL